MPMPMPPGMPPQAGMMPPQGAPQVAPPQQNLFALLQMLGQGRGGQMMPGQPPGMEAAMGQGAGGPPGPIGDPDAQLQLPMLLQALLAQRR